MTDKHIPTHADTDAHPDAPARIVIATGNPHKVEELRAIFAEAAGDLPIVGLEAFDQAFDEPEETGDTFEANATIKARSYARRTRSWCLADDSGLEIDALGGKPGVISSHYFCDGGPSDTPRPERDRMNNERVLRELEMIADDQRSARFVCVMVLADPSGTVRALVRGTFEGRIGRPPRVPSGNHGFGYDPLFLTLESGFARTSAEMEPTDKNRVSHRAVAARQMAELLAGSVGA